MALRGPPRPCLLLLLLRLAPAPVPCGPELRVEVEVGGQALRIGASRTIEHDTFEERDCVVVNIGYQGIIVLSCTEGVLYGNESECEPRECPTYSSISVTLGTRTAGVRPLQVIPSFREEVQLCRAINPLYRGRFTVFCNYGALSVNTSQCVTQWDPMEPPPWSARAKHCAVALGDGSLLLLGGLSDEGPVPDTWQWTPEPGTLRGAWGQPWPRPVPPWRGRFGAAAVRQASVDGEQVVLLGGSDGTHRSDVWRWLREPAVVDVPLAAIRSVDGTSSGDCEPFAGERECDGSNDTFAEAASGRRWDVEYELWPSTDVFVEFMYLGAEETWSAAVALQFDGCRQVFQVRHGRWGAYGCTCEGQRWNAGAWQDLGPDDTTLSGQWRMAQFTFDRAAREVLPKIDGRELLPVAIGACPPVKRWPPPTIFDDSCPTRPAGEMPLEAVELVAWSSPAGAVEYRRLSVTAPSGHWQQLAEQAPWPKRLLHAAVTLPDGDVLVMGGLGITGLLNDVWRWSPVRCLPNPQDADPIDAAGLELRCWAECAASWPHGQWGRLGDAPWTPRSEHAAIWSSVGVLLAGGRSSTSFLNDVWRWSYVPGAPCSEAWRGHWQQLSAAAGFPPRHGFTLVGFSTSADVGGADTVLIVGGYGGMYPPARVEREPVEYPVASRGDLWCGNQDRGQFTNWTRLAPYGPFSDRSQAAAVAAPSLGAYAMLYLGGYDSNSRLVGDVWRWTGTNATAACRTEPDQSDEAL